ncbi:Flp pilus assembly protein CpaB [Arthrobacter crystallopoietes]|uniref:Pilus assembly protein CpaB n=1 Tax=Crystallibacter crystallopoietes TaxID=37928 RepID=A0A1H1F373_9MICC|nr:Flp pilus assembly protein CpaB [Arthrobacter crystallopoietes]AUI49657.1 Flp pilus assembly protein CpaB [Arthrobacter crystallopoietes]SDQ95407.1 pilus assembly protein CpaB [Arthrobacter crystallopoietes]
MKSRLFAGTAAVILALVGAMLVFTYAGNADDRAIAKLDPVGVLVVQKSVPVGTPSEELGEYLAVEALPTKAVAGSALRNLNDTAGKVTATELVPGEQLISERLVAPEELESSGAVEVPKGLHEVSFQLEPQRVAGGQIVPGDHVGVFISMEDGPSASPGPITQLALRKILVISIQRAPQPVNEAGETDTQTLPEGSMLVTVAVDDHAAQKIVFASEFGRIWLSKEPHDAKKNKPAVLQSDEVYR